MGTALAALLRRQCRVRQVFQYVADAPTRIFCFIDDLFFQAKIQETAKKLGVKVEFVKGEKDTVSRILDAPEADRHWWCST